MAAEILLPDHILIDQKLHRMVMVIHEAHHAHGAGLNIKVAKHFLRSRKGKARRIDLRRQLLRLELLVARHHQQIELRFLAVAQKKILAEHHAQHAVHRIARFHRGRSLMVRPHIMNAERVQEIVGPDLPRKSSFRIFRSSFK